MRIYLAISTERAASLPEDIRSTLLERMCRWCFAPVWCRPDALLAQQRLAREQDEVFEICCRACVDAHFTQVQP